MENYFLRLLLEERWRHFAKFRFFSKSVGAKFRYSLNFRYRQQVDSKKDLQENVL